MEISVSNSKRINYSAYINYSTNPHVIKLKKAKAIDI